MTSEYKAPSISPAAGLVLLAALTHTACDRERESFNLLEGLRVVTVLAEPPWIHEGEVTTVGAVLYKEDDSEPVSYRWSWCPVPSDAADGYACALSPADFVEILKRLAPEAPVDVSSFELGTEPTVSFGAPVPVAALQALCGDADPSALAGAELPSCEHSFAFQLRLVAESGGEEIEAVKEVTLLYDPLAPANRNPFFGTRVVAERGGVTSELRADADTPLEGDARYTLSLDIPDEASESYVLASSDASAPDDPARRERLGVTWFIQTGTLDFDRTVLDEQAIPLDITALGSNTWSTPKAYEFQGRAHLYFVLRDGRGGIAWQRRVVELRP